MQGSPGRGGGAMLQWNDAEGPPPRPQAPMRGGHGGHGGAPGAPGVRGQQTWAVG